MHINNRGFGEIYDFFDSVEDINHGLVSVLHSLSFIDDPTRVFRAIRFEQRYGFKISMSASWPVLTLGPHTDKLIRNALRIGIISHLTGGRLFHEIEKILLGTEIKEAAAVFSFGRWTTRGLLEETATLWYFASYTSCSTRQMAARNPRKSRRNYAFLRGVEIQPPLLRLEILLIDFGPAFQVNLILRFLC